MREDSGGSRLRDQADPGRQECGKGGAGSPTALKVVVTDADTGEHIAEKIVRNDYLMLCAGNRYVSGVQVAGKPGRATHIITVKVAP